ncbi:MAG: signal peptide peptidase SppA [Bacteroidales bacterium]|nr:signal peptide peptidase SppA [Bacteroidales bacterium]
MKSFFKFTFASILGFLVAGLLMFFIVLGIIGSIVGSSQDKTINVKEKTILTLNFDNGIVDRAGKNPFEEMNFESFEGKSKVGLNEILKNLKKAKDDENIKGVYINTTSVEAGIATIEEVRNALIDFKTSGKFVIAYSDIYTQGSYYLSSVADKIYLTPEGFIEFKGLSAQLMFFRDALDKIGVEPVVIRGKNNKFKSAVEPYMYNHMSEANRLQTMTYMGSIWNHLLEEISKARNISVSELNTIADSMLIYNAQSAVDYKLIDELKYYDEVLAELKTKTETDQKDDINFLSISEYSNAPKSGENKKIAKDKIAVIYASGEINMGEGSNKEIGSDGLSEAIRKARLDSTVKAVVLRVNSPGGSALASEVIWREMQLTKAVKPIVVSMGDVAASGGYYISAPANKIFANPVTITGSIGVFGLMWNGQNVLDKIGINTDVVNTNTHSDIGNMTRDMSESEYAVIQKGVEDIYNVFLTHVAEGRGKTKEQVDEIGQGRVWSGLNAKEIGLIDEFGGLDAAIEAAKELANLEDYRIIELPRLKDPFEEILKNFGGDVKASVLKEELGQSYKYYNEFNKLLKLRGVQARMPYAIDIR